MVKVFVGHEPARLRETDCRDRGHHYQQPIRQTMRLKPIRTAVVHPVDEEKADIVQNAICLAHALGLKRPKVAILSAVETVSPKIKSTLDAAVLCKMADRGQITGGILDGPLAFDNASPRKPQSPRISFLPLAAERTSSSSPISIPAICWRSSSNTWQVPR
jgi:hypothetical protein